MFGGSWYLRGFGFLALWDSLGLGVLAFGGVLVVLGFFGCCSELVVCRGFGFSGFRVLQCFWGARVLGLEVFSLRDC